MQGGLSRIETRGPYSFHATQVSIGRFASSKGPAKNKAVLSGIAGIAERAEKGYLLFSKDFGEIKVIKYDKALKEEYQVRQF
jgi:hypothetical protein